MTTFKRVGLFVLLALILLPIGAGVGIATGIAATAGVFTRWRRLPAAPARPVRIAGGSIAAVFVEAADGTVYLCNHVNGPCWAQYDEPVVSSLTNDYCAQYPTSNIVGAPPGPPVDTLQAKWCHFEAGEESDYALLSDGSLWLWYHGDSNFANMGRGLAGMACGAGLGLAAALAGTVFLVRRQRRGPAPATPNPPPV